VPTCQGQFCLVKTYVIRFGLRLSPGFRVKHGYPEIVPAREFLTAVSQKLRVTLGMQKNKLRRAHWKRAGIIAFAFEFQLYFKGEAR
jgi:hypothetical protein